MLAALMTSLTERCRDPEWQRHISEAGRLCYRKLHLWLDQEERLALGRVLLEDDEEQPTQVAPEQQDEVVAGILTKFGVGSLERLVVLGVLYSEEEIRSLALS